MMNIGISDEPSVLYDIDIVPLCLSTMSDICISDSSIALLVCLVYGHLHNNAPSAIYVCLVRHKLTSATLLVPFMSV